MQKECRNCIAYKPPDGVDFGRCRLKSPGSDGWPIVQPADWCQEFEAREPAVEANGVSPVTPQPPGQVRKGLIGPPLDPPGDAHLHGGIKNDS